MIQFKIGKNVINVPSSYSELTVGQFFKLRDQAKDGIDMLAILTHQTREYWAEQVDIDKISVLMESLDWVKNIPNFASFLRPDRIEILGTWYDIPKGLGLHTLDQHYCFEDLIMKSNTMNDIDIIPQALAIYFQPLIDKSKFDRDRLPAIEELITTCRIEEAFPVASFFLLKYKKYSQRKQKHYTTNLLRKKEELALIDSISTASLQRFGIFRRVCVRALRRFFNASTLRYMHGFFMTRTKQITERNSTEF